MDFPHEIIYKNTRNAYARINRDGVVVFTIPTRLKNNEKFLTEFLDRGEKLYQRYSKKEKLKSTTDDELLIFWEKLSWSDFFDNDKSYSKVTKEKKLKESREIETLYLYRNSKLNYTGVFSETMNLEESEVKYLKFGKIFASKSMFRDMILQNWKRNDFLSQNKAEGINYQQTYTCRKEIKRNSLGVL